MTDTPPGLPTESLHPDSSFREFAEKVRNSSGDAVPAQIGPYRILQTLGEGGMGTVYLAEQTKPIHRKVALKIIKLGMDTKSVIARFEAEREALALMNHPNVAKVFDAGATETGRPYFVMEYVEGVPLTQFCDDGRLTLHERLSLFMQVCQAVQHAHQKGIIHRDLKPSNVLVAADPVPSLHDKEGRKKENVAGAAPALDKEGLGGVFVKVIDFGIAKATQQKLTEQTFATEQGMLVGTPAYMSPEQADPFTQDIDTRTDIYSLGVILYELLVGALPFDPDTLRKAALSEIQRIIREVDPPKPSSRVGSAARTPPLDGPQAPTADFPHEPQAQARGLSSLPPYQGGTEGGSSHTDRAPKAAQHSMKKGPHSGPYKTEEPLRQGRGPDARGRSDIATIASRRGTDPKSLHRQIRGDLDWIVMKCLEKDRTRRYDTANALVMELQRYLNNEPVLAGPPSAAYRLRKFVRRNRVSVGAVAGIVTALTAGLVVSDLQRRRAVRAEELAATRLTDAETARDDAIKARDESDAVTKFLSDMLAAVDPGKEGKDVTVRELLDKSAGTISEEFHDKPLIEAHLRRTVSITYLGLGLYEKALTNALNAAVLYSRVKGDGDPATLVAKNLVSALLYDAGNFSKSEAQSRATIEIQRRVLGEEHPQTLASIDNLANAVSAQGRFAEAAELHRQSWVISSRVLGEEHPDTLISMNNLANMLSNQGQYSQAEELYRRVFEIRRRVLGEEHPKSLNTLHNLAVTLTEQGRYTQAEELHRNVLESRRRVLGEEHPDTLYSASRLAYNLYKQLRCAEAEELLRQALSIQRRVLGAVHPQTLATSNLLGNSLHGQGRYAEAEQVFRESLEIMRPEQGEDNPTTLALMNGLTGALYDLGRLGEAEELARKTVEIRRRVLGEEHPHTLGTMNNLARIIQERGRLEESESMQRRIREVRSRVLGDEHPDTLSTLHNIADNLRLQGRHAEAEQLYRETLDVKRRTLGEEHPDTLLTMSSLASNCGSQDRSAEAEELFRRTLEIRRRVLGEEHPDVAESWYNVAEMITRAGRCADAEPLSKNAGSIWALRSPPNHPSRQKHALQLGAILLCLQRYSEAEPQLLASYDAIRHDPIRYTAEAQTTTLEQLTRLYESWDAAEPGKGYAEKAAEWRAKLDQFNATNPAP